MVGFLALTPISTSIHYANEYADYETDSLTRRTHCSGGSGALPESGLPRKTALYGAWIALLIGSAAALVGWIFGNLSYTRIVILVCGAFFGWMYSMPPLKLAWRGLGELTNTATGGVLQTIFGYSILASLVDWFILLAAIPFGILVFNNLLAVTWPDRLADACVGKNTLAVRREPEKLRILYIFVAVVVYLLLYLLRENVYPGVVAASGLLALPFVLWGGITYTRRRSPFPANEAM